MRRGYSPPPGGLGDAAAVLGRPALAVLVGVLCLVCAVFGSAAETGPHTQQRSHVIRVDDPATGPTNTGAHVTDPQLRTVGADAVGVDVVVYGATPSGVIAAVQSARLGKRTALVSTTGHVGGVMTSGLGAADFGEQLSVRGAAREYFQRIMRWYSSPTNWRFGDSFTKYKGRAYYDQRANWFVRGDALYAHEPKVGEQIMLTMLREAGVELIFNQRLDRSGRYGASGRITSIRFESGESIQGKVFIDATYEGDLLAAAGVSYTVGREPASKYGENHGGARPPKCFNLSPFKTPGKKSSGLLSGLVADSDRPVGAGDAHVQSYTYRMTLTQSDQNKVAIRKPAGYDPRQFELILRALEKGDAWTPVNWAPMPNFKVDSNSQSPFGTDFVNGGSDKWAEASYAERDAIAARHRAYVLGLWYTMQTNPRVPAQTRRMMAGWGLARDEFTDNGNFPRHIYVREGRRMVGAYVMTESNVYGGGVSDPVALGSYWLDCHRVRRYVTGSGKACEEGSVYTEVKTPYGISYRSLTPKTEQAANLLVTVAISASHAAYMSLRMEPVFMILGQAAAAAASIAIDKGVAVQSVPYGELKALIVKNKGCVQWGVAPCKY